MKMLLQKVLGLMFVASALTVGNVVDDAFGDDIKRVQVTDSTELKVGDTVYQRLGAGYRAMTVEEVLDRGRVKVKWVSPPHHSHTLPRRILYTGESQVPAQKSRTWTDASGAHKIEAVMVKQSGDVVELKKSDGAIVKIPIDKLSAADQEFLKNPPKASSPFEVVKPAEPKKPTVVGPASKETIEITEFDRSQLQQIAIESPGVWGVKPAEVTEDVDVTASQPIQLRSPPAGRNSFFEKPHTVFVDSIRGHAFITHKYQLKNSVSRVEVCDLKNGKSLEVVEFEHSASVIDVSPTGQFILARKNGLHHGQKSRLDIFDRSREGWDRVLSFAPSNAKSWADWDVVFAAFAAEDHVVSVDIKGNLILWDLTNKKAVYSMKVPAKSVPTISLDRMHLVVATQSGVAVIAPMTGKTLGSLPGAGKAIPKLALHSNGSLLAGVLPQRVIIWDMATGALSKEIFLDKKMTGGQASWVSDNLLLVDNSILVDIENRVQIWQYQGGEVGDVAGGKLWTVLSTGNKFPKSLSGQELPHKKAADVASGLSPDDMLALKPGTKVQLTVAGELKDEQVKQITAALKTKLEERDLVVADKSEIVLTAKVSKGKDRESKYHSVGTLKTKETVHELSLTENGKSIWSKRFIVGPPFVLMRNRRESADEALARAMVPQVSFFQNARVPQYVARAPKGGVYGASKLALEGLQPAEVK